ncbi:CPBP family intramembrane glutamic endopeptidase [Stenomitos frigidus]|uniref:CPBP family intramembrane metalloprotease domain-containing protein n=1 Tax=Stenomitos frigidus ULC18 TaxID=2107698 RepID=A0A2T1E384_9CYAN|nr:type II CAAX endopeptidase family protein [Stenomitos frigidus]PSB27198.1 CPBP family intramembrane metalloprotease domain-containing protein [Stenomitos frigidus ULC18]
MTISERLNLLVEAISHSSATVKVLAFFLMWLILWLPIAIPLAIVLKWQPPKPLEIGQKIPLVLSLYALAPLVLWGFTHIEEKTFATYGLTLNRSSLISLLFGLGLGVLGVGLLFSLERWVGWITLNQANQRQFFGALLPTLAIGLVVSFIEELVFRGFLLNQLQHDYSTWVAAASSSLIFALLHLVWEGTEISPQLPGLWLMGIVLVIARWTDGGSLGLACGLHAGWVWGIASLDTAQLIQYTDSGPEWMTGLKKQPLAGGMGLLLMGVTGVMLWIMGR